MVTVSVYVIKKLSDRLHADIEEPAAEEACS